MVYIGLGCSFWGAIFYPVAFVHQHLHNGLKPKTLNTEVL